MLCNHYQAFDADLDRDLSTTARRTTNKNTRPRYGVRRQLLSSRIEILTHGNLVVLSVQEKPFERYYNVYEGVEREHASVTVRMRGTASDALLWCEFTYRISGDDVRVSTTGDCGDAVAFFYMERHAGELPPLQAKPRGKVIGRIRRPELSDDEYLVATKGVDLTLLLLLWVVRHDVQENHGPMGSVPTLTKYISGA